MAWILSKGDPLQSSKPVTTEFKIFPALIDGSTRPFEVRILAWDENHPPRWEVEEGLEQVCLLKLNLTGLLPEVLQHPRNAGEASSTVLSCKVEIKIEGSMLEFRVLVAGMECCKTLARDA